jgi:hypothetical protein
MEQIRFPLVHARHKKLFISIYLGLVLIFSAFTWGFLQTADALIQNRGDRLVALLYRQPMPRNLPVGPVSLTISTDGQIRTLITFPNGKSVGTTNKGEGVNTVENTRINLITVRKETLASDQGFQNQIWELMADKPAPGRYLIKLMSLRGGDYSFHINATDGLGFYNKVIDQKIKLKPGVTYNYVLNYNQNAVHKTSFGMEKSLKNLLNLSNNENSTN